MNTVNTENRSSIRKRRGALGGAHPTARELGIRECKLATTESLVFSPDTRRFCEQNVCGQLGKTWACPPAVGSYTDCVKICKSFKSMMVFSTVTDLKGRYNPQGWHEARIAHERATAVIAEEFRRDRSDCLVLSTEGCEVCERCTYPEGPCVDPEHCYPSVEGYGILVMDVVKKLGMKYHYGGESLTYFSFILF
ncbi:MAG: DUF2284 domain-containing protein [Eubacterium sp.]|nr:DUF2284 domain-containing protein [Eubacterium sp.]